MTIKFGAILTLLALILTACMSAQANAEEIPVFRPTQSPQAKPAQGRQRATAIAAGPETTGKSGIFYRRWRVSAGGVAGIDETWGFYWDGQIATPYGETWTIDAETIAALIQETDRDGFYTLKDSYTSLEPCADCLSYEITVKNGQQSKTVQFTDGSTALPPALATLHQALKDLITRLSPPTASQ